MNDVVFETCRFDQSGSISEEAREAVTRGYD